MDIFQFFEFFVKSEDNNVNGESDNEEAAQSSETEN